MQKKSFLIITELKGWGKNQSTGMRDWSHILLLYCNAARGRETDRETETKTDGDKDRTTDCL